MTERAAPERFYLVDGPSYLYRAYHAIGHLSTSRGLPTNATLGITMMLWKILREDRPAYMGIAWDAPGPTFRHQRFEAYKQERPGMPRDLVEQIPWVRRSCEALGLPILEAPRYEADDILAMAAARLAGTPIELVLVTADKDALQLVGPKVTVLSVLGRTGERIVYDAADPVARDLAERFVALAGASGQAATAFLDAVLPDRPRRAFERAAGLTGEALVKARGQGTDAGYIAFVDSRPFEPCNAKYTLLDAVPWARTILPLVDIRMQAVVRRGRSGLTTDYDGSVLIDDLNDPRSR